MKISNAIIAKIPTIVQIKPLPRMLVLPHGFLSFQNFNIASLPCVASGLLPQPRGTRYSQRTTTNLTALALNCTLKPSNGESSTEVISKQILEELSTHGVQGQNIRVVDFDLRVGVEADMDSEDQWPQIADQIRDTDVLVFATRNLGRPYVQRRPASPGKARCRTVPH